MAAQRVLIVDDEPLIRMSLQDALEERGFLVEEATDATQALIILNKSADLEAMITDVKMPGADGLTLAGEAVAIRPQLRVVIMSGHANAADPGIPSSATFMRKPFPLVPFADWLWSAAESDPAGEPDQGHVNAPAANRDAP